MRRGAVKRHIISLKSVHILGYTPPPPSPHRFRGYLCSFPITSSTISWVLVTIGYRPLRISSLSYFINLLFINEPQCLESSLHTLIVAISGKPWASFQVVKNNLRLKGMHTIWIHFRTGLLENTPRFLAFSEILPRTMPQNTPFPEKTPKAPLCIRRGGGV